MLLQSQLTGSNDEDIDISALIDITNCFTSLIMLTKNSASQDRGHDSVGVGFDRRAVLFAALKEGRIFMEQFIKTTKVFLTRMNENNDKL